LGAAALLLAWQETAASNPHEGNLDFGPTPEVFKLTRLNIDAFLQFYFALQDGYLVLINAQQLQLNCLAMPQFKIDLSHRFR
jgi:hypothetical protein